MLKNRSFIAHFSLNEKVISMDEILYVKTESITGIKEKRQKSLGY